MTWQAVARKDFQDSIRSWWLIGLTAIFVVFVSLAAGGVGYFFEDASSSDVLGLLNGVLITTFVPLLSLVVSFSAISLERESGSVKLLLALPHSREDVIIGKFVGRSLAMVIAVVVGFVVPGLILAAFAEFQAVNYVGYIGWVAILAVVFVAIGIGISANTTTQWRSIAVMLGFYALFVVFWVMLQLVGLFIIILFLQSDWPSWMPWEPSEVLLGLRVFNPTGSFKILTSAFLQDMLFAPGAEDVRGVRSQTVQFASALMLVFWTSFPLALGLYRFEEADL